MKQKNLVPTNQIKRKQKPPLKEQANNTWENYFSPDNRKRATTNPNYLFHFGGKIANILE